MALYWSGNDNGVDVVRVKELSRVSNSFEIRIQRANMSNAYDVRITDCFESAMRNIFDGANQKRSPITASKHADRDLFLHIFGGDPAKRKIVAGLRMFFRSDFTSFGKIGARVRRVSFFFLSSAGRLDSTICSATTRQVLNMI